MNLNGCKNKFTKESPSYQCMHIKYSFFFHLHLIHPFSVIQHNPNLFFLFVFYCQTYIDFEGTPFLLSNMWIYLILSHFQYIVLLLFCLKRSNWVYLYNTKFGCIKMFTECSQKIWQVLYPFWKEMHFLLLQITSVQIQI